MFVAVGIAEGAVTVLLPLVPSFETDSHYIALIDALVVGLISALAFVFLRWNGSERPRSLLQGDWVNAAVVFLVVAGFETALHPLSLGLQRIYPEFEATGMNAFLMACVVSSVSGWIVYVEDRIRQLGPARGVRWQHIGGALLIGAFFCALCVSAVSAVREINKGIFSFETRLETELGVSVSRSMALTEKLGRVAMLDVNAQQRSLSVQSAVSKLNAHGANFLDLVARYLAQNSANATHLSIFPSVPTLRRSLNAVIEATKKFQTASAPDKLAAAYGLQNSIDEFAPLGDRIVAAVTQFEKRRAQLNGTRAKDILTGVLAFLMAIALLVPMLRLSGAQVGKIGDALQDANRLNANLTSYQRALDDHAIFTVSNQQGKIIQANEHFLRLSGYAREEVLSQTHRIVKSNIHPPEFFEDLWNTISNNQVWRGEICNRACDGRLYWVDSCITPLLGHDGKLEQYVCIAYDITQRKQLEVLQQRKERLNKTLLRLKTDLVHESSIYENLPGMLEDLRSLMRGTACAVVELGRSREGEAWGMMIGQCKVNSAAELPAGTQPVLCNEGGAPPLVQDVLRKGELFGGQGARQIGASQFVGWPIIVGMEVVGVLLVDAEVSIGEFEAELQATTLALSEVFAARREAGRRRTDEQNTKRIAKRDPLTGLGNRRELMEEFESRTDHPAAQFGLLLIDLDRFKPINDTFGHLVGDTVLRVVSERLCAVAKGDTSVCRIGGDEFAILSEVRASIDSEELMALAGNILKELSRPIACQQHEVSVSGSIGVAVYPRDGVDFQEVLHCADAAMYRAKTTRSETQMFDISMDEGMRFRAELETDLKQAIESGAIVPNYQPYVDLKTGLIAGHEVLARWDHPKYGVVSPTDFVKVAEEAGLVDKLFWQMLRVSCRKHLAANLSTILSVNLSPAQINNPIFAKRLIEELQSLAFPPTLLEVEITETSMIGDLDRARPLLLLLKSFGIQIALDDFGTGHSSLALLRSMPISKLKIDRSFTVDLESNAEKKGTLVNAILGIAQAMDLKVTAEGIEFAEVAEYLRVRGCQYGQGYLYGKASTELMVEPSGVRDAPIAVAS